MPRYEFKCKDHGLFERILQFSSPSKFKCPRCKKVAKRFYGNQIPQLNPVFKGFLDIGSNRWISSQRQIRDIEKSEDKVYASHKELVQESQRYRKNNIEKLQAKSTKSLDNELNKVLKGQKVAK